MRVTAAAGQRSRGRIVERPRLLALLDESSARVRTLVAPAGYGKTTLAEQWATRDGRRWSWFTARGSFRDVAALALGFARAADEIVPGCRDRVRELLRVSPAAGGNVDVLAEILVEELEGWPQDAWLVFDEYQEIASAESERLVAELAEASPIQLLIASRVRPSWVSARHMLYDEVLELNQTSLAMDSAEAARVLAGRSTSSASGLVALANGWPAVIGLASVSRAQLEGDQVPESLYQFFAEEVFGRFDVDVQTGLSTLAVAPVLDRELAERLLGAERADLVCAEAQGVGLLIERGEHLELHPLARSFLADRGACELVPDPDVVPECVDHYRERGDLDAAFEVISRHGRADQLEPLLLAGLDDLLETARLSTIEEWCDFASAAGVDGPVFSLARAEVALRQGRGDQAQALAALAGADEFELSVRALLVAGFAAHIGSREEEGLELFERAERSARTEADRLQARWGQLYCAIELNAPDTAPMLDRLSAEVDASNPREAVRLAGVGLFYQLKIGSRLELTGADAAAKLLELVGDPLIESGFLNIYSYSLALSARYEDADRAVASLLALARRHRLDFVYPFTLSVSACAAGGRRDWSRAEDLLDQADEAAIAQRNEYATHATFAVRLRVLAQQGRPQAALALEVPELGSAMPHNRYENQATLAVMYALAGKTDEARALLDDLRGATAVIEVQTLVAVAEAVVAVRRRDPDATDRVLALESTAFRTGALDLLVFAYRSLPELLTTLLATSEDRQRLYRLIRRAGDEDVARAAGHLLDANEDATAALSRREREVFELLRQGMPNREIARRLVIAEATVKVHAHRIYEKLGVRSRSALAMQALLERPKGTPPEEAP